MSLRITLNVRDVRRVNNDDGSQYGELVRLAATESADNAAWASGQPSASLDVYVTNPAAFGSFTAGSEYTAELTPVQAAPVETPAEGG